MKRDGILVLGAGELGMAVLRKLARLREQGLVLPICVLLRKPYRPPMQIVRLRPDESRIQRVCGKRSRCSETPFRTAGVHVLQQVVAGDRVVSHLRVTGRFTGCRRGIQGRGQRIDYVATDIMRVADGQVAENWHVEDHETLHRQLA